MGVPKFFRWISERYPALSTSVKPDDVPEFDCLYLDMNGIIHPCSHPSDDPTFRISEEQIFDNVFRYIEFLIQTIKPQKTFFMAVDGCAPRAKMNQQRARRFSTAKKAEEDEQRARQRGVVIPDKKDKFDSNTITTGTDFMDRLDSALRYYVQRRISENDEVWTKPQVIYSGHQTPGEGEHKIADYVRYLRTAPDYDGNLRHCLYGLDADLIHLALASHEKNFCLLREEVKFGSKGKDRAGSEKKNSPIVKPEKVNFFLLSVNILRSYLELHEYKDLSGNLNENWDKIRLIDDWIFLNFLVGNDFIPHAPHLHIKQQHVPELIGYHIKTLRYFMKKDGTEKEGERRYLIKDGLMDMPAFIHFITLFADDFDTENHQKYEADAAWLGGKRGARRRQDAFGQAKAQGKSRAEAVKAMYTGNANIDIESSSQSKSKAEGWQKPKKTSNPTPSAFDFGSEDSNSENEEMDLSGLPEEMRERIKEQGENNKITKMTELDKIEDDAFTTWRQRYYWSKWKGFGVQSYDPNAESDFVHSDFKWNCVDNISADYVKTLQWICHYYFNGIQSWSWFYPHHYSPFLTDVAMMLKKCVTNHDEDNNQEKIQQIVTFPNDKPFLPFQQLMGVLPPASRKCLPIPYHKFMTDENSPIIDFYPTNFGLDLNGKDADWEAVVCIPFIDEKRLVECVSSCDEKLTEYEMRRNRHVPATVFTRSEERIEKAVEAPNSKFRPVEINFATAVDYDNINVHRIDLELVNRDTIGFEGRKFTPGFPYLDYIPHISEYTNASVMVFEQASNNKSCILYVQNEEKTVEQLANKLLDQKIKFKTWVNWPHMFKAQVCEVFDAHRTFYPNQKGFKDTGAEHSNYHMLIDQITQDRLYKRRGIDAKDYTVIARVKPRIGQKLMFIGGKGFEVRDIFSDEYEYHLAEFIQVERQDGFEVRNSTMEDMYLLKDTGSKTEKSMSKSNNLSYKVGTQIFITNDKHEHFGCHGKVVGIDSKGKIQAELFRPWYPNIKNTAQKASENYRRSKLYSTQDLCHQFQCSFNMVNIFVSMTLFHYGEKSKILMSFNCKNEKYRTYNRRYCVPNFVNGEKSVKFTQRFLDDVNIFYENWPQVFDFIKSRGRVARNNADVKDKDMKKFDNNWTDETTQQFVEWLKNDAPWNNHEDNQKMSFTTRTLVKSDVEMLEAELEKQKSEVQSLNKSFTSTVSFNDTFQWCPGMNKFQPNRKDLFRLYDRVLLVRSAIGRGIPAGRYGTVVAEHYTAFSHILDVNNECDNPTEVDVLFDQGGENVSNFKDNILRVHVSYLLKIESTVIRKGGSKSSLNKYQNHQNTKFQGQDNRYQQQNNNQDYHAVPFNYNNKGQKGGYQKQPRERKTSNSKKSNQQNNQDFHNVPYDYSKDQKAKSKKPVKLMQKSQSKKTTEHLENELKRMLNVSQPVVTGGNNPNQPSPAQQSPSVLSQLFPNQQNFNNNQSANNFDLQNFSQQMVRPPISNNNAVNQLFSQQQQQQQVFSPRQTQNFPQQAPQFGYNKFQQQQNFMEGNNNQQQQMLMNHVRQPMGPPSLPSNHPSNQSFGFKQIQGNSNDQNNANMNRSRGGGFQHNTRNFNQVNPNLEHASKQMNQKPYQQFVNNMQGNNNNNNIPANQHQQPMQQQQPQQFANPAIDHLFNMQNSQNNNNQRGGNKKFAPNFSASTSRSGRKGARK